MGMLEKWSHKYTSITLNVNRLNAWIKRQRWYLFGMTFYSNKLLSWQHGFCLCPSPIGAAPWKAICVCCQLSGSVCSSLLTDCFSLLLEASSFCKTNSLSEKMAISPTCQDPLTSVFLKIWSTIITVPFKFSQLSPSLPLEYWLTSQVLELPGFKS